jgi:hypothetical protein
LRARLTAATRKADQAEARADQAEERAARYKAHAEMMQQVVDNTLKALHNVEAVTREMSKLQRKLASAKEERAEMAAQVEEYRKRAEHLTKRDEERAKELNKLKGNFSPRDYTIEELIQLEGTLEEGTSSRCVRVSCVIALLTLAPPVGKKKVNEVRVALQVSAEEKKKKECVLCFDEQKDTVFIPCGHLACCRSFVPPPSLSGLLTPFARLELIAHFVCTQVLQAGFQVSHLPEVHHPHGARLRLLIAAVRIGARGPHHPSTNTPPHIAPTGKVVLLVVVVVRWCTINLETP